MLCPLGVCSPFLLPNALSPVLCLQESSLFPKRVGTSWEAPKLCCAKCRGELTWGILLRGPGGSGEGAVCGHSSCTSPLVMVIYCHSSCLLPWGQRGSHPLLPISSPLPARHILSQWLPHSWQLVPFQSLPGGLLWHSQLLLLPVIGRMPAGSQILPFSFLASLQGRAKGFCHLQPEDGWCPL